MSGGLYRSANASAGGPLPPDDGATFISAEPPNSPALEGAPPPEQVAEGSAAANSAVMAMGSLVSRGTGFLRTMAITAALGKAIGDAYTSAQILPGMVYEFLLGGVLTSVLVPVLVRRRKADADRGEAYMQRLLTLAVLALGVAALLAVVAAPLLTWLVAGGDETTRDYPDLITALSRFMLPMLFFTGLSALISAVLNTRGHFAAPMWAPILNNIVVIAVCGIYVLVYGARVLDPNQMTIGQIVLIGGGTLLGVAVQAAGLFPALRKVGFRWKWRFDFGALGLRELGHLGAWMFCYVAVSQIGVIAVFNLVNRATGRGEAGALSYNNIYLLMMMAHGIVAVSIITALLPRMSAAAADGRFADLAADLSRGTRTVTAVLAPIAVCYWVLATPVVFALFQRGAFTADDARSTVPVLMIAGLALVPFAISQLFTFAFYALPDTRTPALINIPVVVVRVLVLIGLFAAFSASFAASAAMIGNAVSYVAAAVLSAWLLRPRMGSLGMGQITRTFGKVIVAAGLSAVVGTVVVKLLPGGDAPVFWESVVQILVGGAAVGLTYLGLAMLLRISEITEVIGMVRSRLGR